MTDDERKKLEAFGKHAWAQFHGAEPDEAIRQRFVTLNDIAHKILGGDERPELFKQFALQLADLELYRALGREAYLKRFTK